MASSDDAPLLSVTNLSIDFGPDSPPVVSDVSFNVDVQESVALIGESGAGKTLTALSIAGLLPNSARIVSGSILWKSRDLSSLKEAELRRYRGRQIAMIFQEPSAAMNPALSVGKQLAEVVRFHRGGNARTARLTALDLLGRVHIDNPRDRFGAYPHELSGGMLQRVMIAIALAGQPDLLIADEPTTALDVSVQHRILELLMDIRAEFRMSMLFVTHNLGLVAELADRALVMKSGQIVEQNNVFSLFEKPVHPYTRELLEATPRRPTRNE